MNLAIAIHGAPYASQSSGTALRFARAALAEGHTLYRVFFYHEGIHTASALRVAPQDEADAGAGWVELAQASHVELCVCIAAALKRGLIDDAERARHGLAAANLHPAFSVVGLGQLIDAVAAADRFVTFAAS